MKDKILNLKKLLDNHILWDKDRGNIRNISVANEGEYFDVYISFDNEEVSDLDLDLNSEKDQEWLDNYFREQIYFYKGLESKQVEKLLKGLGAKK